MRKYLDLLGMSTSLLCALHCLLFPVLLTAGLWTGFQWIANPRIELVFIGIGVPVAGWALTDGYRRHRSLRPLLLGGTGLALLLGGRLLPGNSEHLLTPLGGFLLAVAHLLNWRRDRRRSCPPNLPGPWVFLLMIGLAMLTYLALSDAVRPAPPSATEVLEAVWKPVDN